MEPVDEDLLREAVALAQSCANLTLNWYGVADLEVDRKGDGTPVTAADRAAEEFFRTALADRHPDDSVLGEEFPDTIGTSGRRWIMDPIDGTKAFTRAVPLYSTLLAVDDEHGPAVGVIVLPALGEAVWAGRGRGCWWERGLVGYSREATRVTVSERATVDGCYLMSSSYSHWPEPALLGVKRAGAALRTWGDGYGYALVATGRADAMVDPEAALWDLAPMPVILSEAGGCFTALDGSPDPGAGSGVATNGHLHAELLALLTAPV